MLLSIVLAALIAVLASSLVLLAQGLAAKRLERDARRARAIWALAATRGGSVTPAEAAAHLGVPLYAASRLLRSMVDDTYVRMDIDDRAGVLRFTYSAVEVEAPGASQTGSSASGSANGAGSPRSPTSSPPPSPSSSAASSSRRDRTRPASTIS